MPDLRNPRSGVGEVRREALVAATTTGYGIEGEVRFLGAPTGPVPFSYCPRCGASLSDPGSFVQEFWVASETVYHCWCRACSFTWNLVEVHGVQAHGLAE